MNKQIIRAFNILFFAFLTTLLVSPALQANGRQATYDQGSYTYSQPPNHNQYQSYAGSAKEKPRQQKVMSFFGVGRKSVWDNKIVPGITFNYRDGYTLTVGPKLTYLKAFGNDKALRTSLSYVPLMMSDFKAGYGKIGYTDLRLEYTHHLNRNFFYQLTYDANHFSPNSNLKSYVKTLGAKIDDELIHTAAVSVGYRIFSIKVSTGGRRFPIPVYLKASYRFGKNYKFGTYVADAGNQYDLRNEFRITLWPLLRRF